MKCFLSHSSADKDHYVRLIADRMRRINLIYDEYTFDAGMKTSDEILKNLDSTDLFVLFLSDASLESRWVKDEILDAKVRLDRGTIERIFPIIIDPKITHRDARIPDWMRNAYNLRLITRPTVALRRIQQRLRELSWTRHPRIREKEKIFVGRNELISSFEERVDDFSKSTPICIVAAGMKQIGRRAFLKHALTKTNIIEPSYDPLRLHMSQEDGLEGFIIKVHDLGITSTKDVSDLMGKSIEEKISIAVDLCQEIQAAKDLLLIEDEGSIVTFDGTISSWFLDILSKVDSTILFAIGTAYRVAPRQARSQPIFAVNVPELNAIERRGLLKRYSELEDISLTRDDFDWIAGLLTGYPDQVFFAIDSIKSEGIERTKRNSHEITEFNLYRASIALRRFEDDTETLDFLRLLAGFEFVSYELLNKICDNAGILKKIDDLISESICEEIGAAREYIRLNDIIKDYISRNKLEINPKYKERIVQQTQEYLRSDDTQDDASEYFFYLKTALVGGVDVDERKLIPAHFLSTMRTLYSAKRYAEVVKLCDRILLREGQLEPIVEQDIRYYLCQSLARLRQNRFLNEVQKIGGAEHQFLLGFYYRHQGRYHDAEECYKKSMRAPRSEKRARRELVTVYLAMDDWEAAKALATENYYHFPSNAHLIQAYFNCLVQLPKSEENERELNRLLDAFLQINSERSKEMYASAKAAMIAIYDGDQDRALQVIDDAISSYQDNNYPIFTKIDICSRFSNSGELKRCLDMIGPRIDRKSSGYNSFKKAEAIYYALVGNSLKAKQIVEHEMRDFSEVGRARLLDRISQISRR